MTGALDGTRMLVVGGSSGVGRAIGLAAADAGARVAFAGRRTELVEQAAAEGGAGAVALHCDVREPDQCERVVTDTLARFGGLDQLVLAVGVTYLADVAETTAQQWQNLTATNLVGPALVTSAALDELVAARGKVLFISSTAVPRPWPGLVPYASVKAGVEKLALGLQDEYPEVGFSVVAIGPTYTGILDGIDRTTVRDRFRRWREKGYVGRGQMSPEGLADHLVAQLASPMRLPYLMAVPSPPPPRGEHRGQASPDGPAREAHR
jgi:NAD(P)-dependent dehydrogenase (short-subunit alcohol dehydrogenase family)